MLRAFIHFLLAITIATVAAGCSKHIKATGENTYTSTYKSYRNEDDARKQAVFKATMECTGLGKKMNILSEEELTKRGFIHVLEFECVD